MTATKSQKRPKVSKKLQAFIDSIANVQKCKTAGIDTEMEYVSKTDGSYLTFVGLENDLKYLMDRGISEQIQTIHGGRVACIGFNPEEQKWYGWSHRAIFGFGVGAECKKGHCHYRASNEEEYKESCLAFWAGDLSHASDDKKAEIVEQHGEKGVLVTYTYDDKVPNKSLRGTLYENFSPFPEEWGKGEWTAKTLEDAKQMAIDFADGVG